MSQNKAKKGIKNTIISLLCEGIILLLGLLVPRIIIISYGSDVNGLLSSTTQLLSYLTLFETGMSAVMNNTLYKAFSCDDKNQISYIYSSGRKYFRKIGINYGLALLVSAIFFTIFIKTNLSKGIVFSVVLLSGINSLITFYFLTSIICVISSDGNYYFVAWMNLLTKVLSYGVTIIAALLTFNIVLIKLLGVVVTIIIILSYRLYFRSKYKWIEKVKNPSIEIFKQRKYFVVHQIASLLFSATDITLLSLIADLTIVSIYTVYNYVVAAIQTVMESITSSFIFALGQAYSEDISKYKKIHDTFKLFYIQLYFMLITIAYVLYIPFVKIYTRGADVEYADPIIALLFCIISLLNSCRRIDNKLAEISWYVKQTMSHTIIEALLNLSVSLILVFPLKIYGVLIGTITAILFRVVIGPYYSEKKILKRKIIHGYKHALVNWFIFAGFAFIKRYVLIDMVNYFDLIICGLLCAIIICPTYLLINGLFFKNEYKYIRFYLKDSKHNLTIKKST